MTATAKQYTTEGPEGVIFLPGIPEPFDVSANPTREISRLEFAILDGRADFRDLTFEEQMECFNALREHRTRILGDRVLASTVEI